MTNRLASEKSPYLKQHENNPVDWYPWNSETLKLARNQKKPIFLSVGYASCHWCHVMAHEIFEDQETAKIMNEKFINIKITNFIKQLLISVKITISHHLILIINQ